MCFHRVANGSKGMDGGAHSINDELVAQGLSDRVRAEVHLAFKFTRLTGRNKQRSTLVVRVSLLFDESPVY